MNLSLIVVMGSSIWVLFDATTIGVKKGQIHGLGNLGPWGWFFACLLVWIISFPLYLAKRSELKRINIGLQQGNQPATLAKPTPPIKRLSTIHWLGIIVTGSIAWLAFFGQSDDEIINTKRIAPSVHTITGDNQQWYLAIIFVLALSSILLIFYALGFFNTKNNKQAPKIKAEHKPKHERQLIIPIKQRLSSFISSPHYKIGIISLSAAGLILLILLVGYFGNEDVHVKRRLEIIASEFNDQVNRHPLEIVKIEPSSYELSSYEDKIMSYNFNANIIPEKPKAKWYRYKIFLTSTSYDVRKTDSLVSPFVADIHFNCATHTRVGNTKEAVESGEDSSTLYPIECISKYAFQDDHWVKKSVSCKSYITGDWETPNIKDGSAYQCSELLPQSD